MKLNRINVIAATACLAVAGCVSSAIKSKKIESTPPQYIPPVAAIPAAASQPWVRPVSGIPYFLPKVQLQLTAILTNVLDSNNFVTNYTLATVVSNFSSWTTNFIHTNSNPQATTNVFATGTSNWVVSSVLIPSTNQFYTISVTPIITPDPEALYALQIVKDKWKVSSDTFNFQVDSNGFLQSLNATNADQTPQIISELAQAAAEIAMAPGLPAVPPPAPGPLGAPRLVQPPPSRIDVIFDPTTPDGIQSADTFLTQLFVQGAPPNSQQARDICPILVGSTFKGKLPPPIPDDYIADYGNANQGIVFRVPLPYILSVKNARAQFGTSLSQYLVMSPNRSPVFSLPVERATFVTRTTAMSFNGGFLASVNYSNPSQAAAVLGLPLTIVSDIFSSITNVLQLKLNIATVQTGIATQQNQLRMLQSTNHQQ